MKAMTKEEARKTIRSYFPEKGIPFVVELEFTKDLSEDKVEEMAISLMSSMMKGGEILPGLKVSKAYRQAETTDSIHVNNISSKVVKLQEAIKKNFTDMYLNMMKLEKACRRLYDNVDEYDDM